MLKTKTKKVQLTVIFNLVLIGILLGLAALAEDANPTPADGAGSTSNNTCTAEVPPIGPLTLQVPILQYTQATGIAEYIKEIYKATLYILVPIGIIIVIFSGFVWIMAGGNQGKISQAKQHITASFWGLTLALLSYVMLSFVGLGTIKDPNAEYVDCVTTTEFGITYTEKNNPLPLKQGSENSNNLELLKDPRSRQ